MCACNMYYMCACNMHVHCVEVASWLPGRMRHRPLTITPGRAAHRPSLRPAAARQGGMFGVLVRARVRARIRPAAARQGSMFGGQLPQLSASHHPCDLSQPPLRSQPATPAISASPPCDHPPLPEDAPYSWRPRYLVITPCVFAPPGKAIPVEDAFVGVLAHTQARSLVIYHP